MRHRHPAVRVLVTATLGLVLLGAWILGPRAAGAQAPSPADAASTTTVDQSLTTTPPLDAENAPDYDNSPDLDMDRITGPRVVDGKVTSTTFWPLGFAAVAILVVFGTIFYRAARGNKGNQRPSRGGPTGAERGAPAPTTE